MPEGLLGKSFVPLLSGAPFQGREYIFGERGVHGGVYHKDITSASLEYSRCVRSDRFKLIYNCTPYHPYGPIDSDGDLPYWDEMKKRHAKGTLGKSFSTAYFAMPRPIWELYDMKSDPYELDNLANDTDHQNILVKLREALTIRMVQTYDFLPLPMPLQRWATAPHH